MAKPAAYAAHLGQDEDPHSYIAALKHFSARASDCAPRNRMIENLRSRSDAELKSMGIERCDIEKRAYRGN